MEPATKMISINSAETKLFHREQNGYSTDKILPRMDGWVGGWGDKPSFCPPGHFFYIRIEKKERKFIKY
jgi:hypothetical protein